MMKKFNLRKTLASLLAVAATVQAMAPAMLSRNELQARAVDNNDRYFYDQLEGKTTEETRAYQNFYNAMNYMDQKNYFLQGLDLDLVEAGYFTSEEVSAYAGGGGNVLSIFSAARDAFYADRPDIFYVDFSALSIRVAKTSDGNYHLYMGTGRRKTYWTESFTDVKQVADAVSAYDKAFAEALTEVETTAASLDGGATPANLVEAAHDYVTTHTSYRLENKFRDDDTNQYLIRTSYGALMNGKAVCEGYARLFKDFMDAEGIPCVLVQGAYKPDADSYELHMWAYVQIDGAWYAVDPTIDDPSNSKKGYDEVGVDGYENHEYLLKGESKMAVKYAPSGIRSESNYTFTYPALNYDNYGSEVVYNSNGLVVSYEETIQSDGEKAGQYTVSYKGMGLRKAREAGYYMLFDSVVEKRANVSSTSASSKVKPGEPGYDEQVASAPLGDYGWTGMCYLAANAEIMMGPGALDDPTSDMYDTDTAFVFKLPQCPYVRFAVTTEKPDPYNFGGMVLEDSYYNGDNMALIATTDMIYNPNGLYKAPPYPTEVSPGLTSALLIDEGEKELRSTYDQDLFFDEEAGKVTLRLSIKDQYNIQNTSAFDHSQVSDFRVLYREGDEIVESDTINITLQSLQKIDSKDENGFETYDEIPGKEVEIAGNQDAAEYLKGKTIVGFVFNFTPSTMYADDNIFYEFDVKGLKAGTLHVPYHVMNKDGTMQEETKYADVEGKEPIAISYLAAHRCAAHAFQSQGYDWNVFGKPTLMDGLDGVDFNNWELKGDTSGITNDGEMDLNDALKDLTHRMVLVATDANSEQKAEMTELMNDQTAVGQMGNAADLEKAEYYNINLTLCKSQVVSTGQAVRVTLGFPAGYGPQDKGKTFKVYHFKKDEKGNIIGVNEIPCEITEYGLVVWCDSFSPFAVVPVDIAKAEATLEGDELAAFKADLEKKSVLYNTNTVGGTVTGTEAVNTPVVIDGKEHASTAANGTIEVEDNDTATLNIQAEEGYVIDSITVAGEKIEVTDKANMNVELPFVELATGANLVDVQFTAESVLEKDAEANEEIVDTKETAHRYSPVTGKCETCEEKEYADGFSGMAGHSLTLGNNIGVNFYMEFDHDQLVDDASVIITLPDGTTVEKTVADIHEEMAGTEGIDHAYHKITCLVPAKDIAKEITIQVKNGDKMGTLFKYCALDYINAYKKGYNEALDDTSVTLGPVEEKAYECVGAMSDYGNLAADYFNKDAEKEAVTVPEEVANVQIEDVESLETTNKNAVVKPVENGELPKGIEYIGSSLILESAITVRHYFKVEKGTVLNGTGLSNDRQNIHGYYIDVPGITAAEFANGQKTQVGDFTINYSPMSYVHAVLHQSQDDSLRNLVKALYKYHVTAKAYADVVQD